MRVFITGTGTGVGKTWLATAFAAELARRGRCVGALKPIETGCDPEPLDALALAAACGHPALAYAPGLYRARLPLAPWAAHLAGDGPPPPINALAEAIALALAPFEDWIVEGAGGLLVPHDARHDVADIVRALGVPLVLVGVDALGTLSHTRTAYEAAGSRGLRVAAIVLTQPEPRSAAHSSLPESATNAAILRARLEGVPVIAFPHVDAGSSQDPGADGGTHAHVITTCHDALASLVSACDAVASGAPNAPRD